MIIKNLKCPECGADLELAVGYDGVSEEAVLYDSTFAPNWGWVVRLECTECSRIYPICRTSKYLGVSEITKEGHNNDCF